MQSDYSFGLGDLGFFNPAENTSIAFDGTMPAELPAGGYDIAPRDLFVSQGFESSPEGVSGVFNTAKAGAESLFKLWGTAQEYKARADQMDLQRAQSAADTTIRKAQIDAATTREVATASLEKYRAETAMQRAASAASGGVGQHSNITSAIPVVLGIAALALVVFGARRKGAK